MTKLGWPVALPRFSRRPSDSTITLCSGEPSVAANVHSWTCGLISVRVTPWVRARPAMSISLSKWPMLPRMALFFIRPICSAVTTSMLPVAVMTMSAEPMTSSSVATW